MGAVRLVQEARRSGRRLEAGEPAFDLDVGQQQDLAVAVDGALDQMEYPAERDCGPGELAGEGFPTSQVSRLPTRGCVQAVAGSASSAGSGRPLLKRRGFHFTSQSTGFWCQARAAESWDEDGGTIEA
ncbi:MAG: hypothetical protein IPQ01_17830 [Zoogloea sp.]|nr:hypothetical protein [Zoogloea sp.]